MWFAQRTGKGSSTAHWKDIYCEHLPLEQHIDRLHYGNVKVQVARGVALIWKRCQATGRVRHWQWLSRLHDEARVYERDLVHTVKPGCIHVIWSTQCQCSLVHWHSCTMKQCSVSMQHRCEAQRCSSPVRLRIISALWQRNHTRGEDLFRLSCAYRPAHVPPRLPSHVHMLLIACHTTFHDFFYQHAFVPSCPPAHLPSCTAVLLWARRPGSTSNRR